MRRQLVWNFAMSLATWPSLVTVSFISPSEWATANSFQILINMFPSDLSLHNFSILKVITLCSSGWAFHHYTLRLIPWNFQGEAAGKGGEKGTWECIIVCIWLYCESMENISLKYICCYNSWKEIFVVHR